LFIAKDFAIFSGISFIKLWERGRERGREREREYLIIGKEVNEFIKQCLSQS